MKYRKKPVVIDAVQFTGDNGDAIVKWIANGPAGGAAGVDGERIRISTLEGTMHADKGDFVIRGVKGEHYPCKPDIFERTYDVVEGGEVA